MDRPLPPVRPPATILERFRFYGIEGVLVLFLATGSIKAGLSFSLLSHSNSNAVDSEIFDFARWPCPLHPDAGTGERGDHMLSKISYSNIKRQRKIDKKNKKKKNMVRLVISLDCHGNSNSNEGDSEILTLLVCHVLHILIGGGGGIDWVEI